MTSRALRGPARSPEDVAELFDAAFNAVLLVKDSAVGVKRFTNSFG
ncbi:hypothetical protein SAMN04515659_0866 [Dyella sp. 333MFSha]|nr:hypothetical protein SAMN04515659_0866 [Dyella sp. 333MFSha]